MSVSRRADLDWLRVLAFGLLIAYHAGMAWSGWAWHLTSIDSIDWLREGMRFVNRWRMPLIFVVSGAAMRFMAERAEARESREIPGASHALTVSEPEAVAETILAAVAYVRNEE